MAIRNSSHDALEITGILWLKTQCWYLALIDGLQVFISLTQLFLHLLYEVWNIKYFIGFVSLLYLGLL
jgi:hypothetical protein